MRTPHRRFHKRNHIQQSPPSAPSPTTTLGTIVVERGEERREGEEEEEGRKKKRKRKKRSVPINTSTGIIDRRQKQREMEDGREQKQELGPELRPSTPPRPPYSPVTPVFAQLQPSPGHATIVPPPVTDDHFDLLVSAHFPFAQVTRPI